MSRLMSKFRGVQWNERWWKPSAWRLPKEPSSLAPEGTPSNKDQDPVPPSKQTWTAMDFVGYWVSDLVNATSWEQASTPLMAGLGTVDTIMIVFLSGILNAIPIVLSGAPGSDYRIPFPIAIRASFGYYFAYFAVVTRAVLAVLWFGVNTYSGLGAVTEAIAAIWPSYRDVTNHLPASAGITTQQMISYIIYFVIQLPFILIPIERLRKLFLWKTMLTIPMSIAMTIWICAKAGNVQGVFNQPGTLPGSTRGWVWVATLTSLTNSWLTACLNMSDYSRYSRRKRNPWAQVPAIIILKTAYSVLGVATVGAGRVLYNKDIWTPIEMLPHWHGSGGRFLAFWCAMLWLLAQISGSISANSVPFGHDAMALFPSWVNVRRGSMICMMLGMWAVVPWILVNNAGRFLTFMSAYGCFICQTCSIMIADYFLIRRGRLDLPALYNPHGRYRYWKGINWRAVVVQFGLMALFLPGVINSASSSIQVSTTYQHFYGTNWIINTFAGLLVYWLLYLAFPCKETLVVAGESNVLDGKVPEEKIVEEIHIKADDEKV